MESRVLNATAYRSYAFYHGRDQRTRQENGATATQ